MLDCGWLEWGGLVIGVIGITLGLFFGLKARRRRELVYSINPVYTRIVRSREATALKVSYRDEPLGDVDVTALQLAIWNTGNISIKPEHIRKEIIVATKPQVRVLEASVRNVSPDTGFELRDTTESKAIGRVPVSWKIFERNDGVSLQLLYLGTSDVDIIVEGLIEGQGKVKQQVTSSAFRSPQARHNTLKVATIWTIISLVVLLTTAVLGFALKMQGPLDIIPLFFQLSLLSSIFGLGGILTTMRTRFPPIGF